MCIRDRKDPLRHLIRNAIDHGIEKPEDRKRAKKSVRGTIVASAALLGGQVEVTVSDDGGGLAVEAIQRRAKTVSYTHLDVYKRQILKGAGCALLSNPY